MAIFSPADRSEILNEIVTFSKANEHIMALVVVGSGSYGYIDELSDLDMVVAIDAFENAAPVMDYMAAQIKQRLPLLYFKQVPQRGLQVYMSDQFLEIDIGYGPYTHAAASRAHWKVLFDKSGTVDEKMRLSWEKHEADANDDAYRKALAECADTVWHHLMHAAVAIKRGLYWRAGSELAIARDSYIGVLGRRYGLDVDRGRELDQLPEAALSVLEQTLCATLAETALWSSLDALTDAIYDELERCGDDARISVTRAQVRTYTDACRSLSRPASN